MTWDELRGLKPVSADLETNIVAGRQRPPRKLKAAPMPRAGWGGNRPTCRSRQRWWAVATFDRFPTVPDRPHGPFGGTDPCGWCSWR